MCEVSNEEGKGKNDQNHLMTRELTVSVFLTMSWILVIIVTQED